METPLSSSKLAQLTKFVESDLSQVILLQNQSIMLGNIAGLDRFSDIVYIHIVALVPAAATEFPALDFHRSPP